MRADQLSQPQGPEIEGPEIASGVLPPDLLRVGEDQEPALIWRGGIVLHRERHRVTWRYQPRSRYPSVTLSRGGIVAHQRLTTRPGAVRLQLHIAGLLLQPANPSQLLGYELLGVEDPVNRKTVLGGNSGREQQQQGQCPDKRTRTGHQISPDSCSVGSCMHWVRTGWPVRALTLEPDIASVK